METPVGLNVNLGEGPTEFSGKIKRAIPTRTSHSEEAIREEGWQNGKRKTKNQYNRIWKHKNLIHQAVGTFRKTRLKIILSEVNDMFLPNTLGWANTIVNIVL